jgi:hypothetical protein
MQRGRLHDHLRMMMHQVQLQATAGEQLCAACSPISASPSHPGVARWLR